MNTQEQAYINGFVKRAAEYGIDENEALEILKEAAPHFINDVREGLSNLINPESSLGFSDAIGNSEKRELWNKSNEQLKAFGIPEHIAKYFQNNASTEDAEAMAREGVKDFYDSEMFKHNHPTLNAAKEWLSGRPEVDKVREWLSSHDIDPETAGLAAGGAGLLAGGYGLAKLLGNKEEPRHEEHIDPRMFMPQAPPPPLPPPTPPAPQRGNYNLIFQ
jgi:hypothetical protein